jgi:hypothetical protein
MVKSAIKIGLFSILFFVFFVQKGNAQITSELSNEQHQIFTSIFKKSGDSPTCVYFQTFKYESWMTLIWDKEFLKEDGIAFCVFDDPELKEAFKVLRDRVEILQIKTLNKSILDTKFKLTRNSKKKRVLFVSEPVIIREYAFQFLKSKTDKSLRVQKKDKEGNWNYECGVPLLFELH